MSSQNSQRLGILCLIAGICIQLVMEASMFLMQWGWVRPDDLLADIVLLGYRKGPLTFISAGLGTIGLVLLVSATLWQRRHSK